eukprot:1211536-Prymnesium_polylepis.1
MVGRAECARSTRTQSGSRRTRAAALLYSTTATQAHKRKNANVLSIIDLVSEPFHGIAYDRVASVPHAEWPVDEEDWWHTRCAWRGRT